MKSKRNIFENVKFFVTERRNKWTVYTKAFFVSGFITHTYTHELTYTYMVEVCTMILFIVVPNITKFK